MSTVATWQLFFLLLYVLPTAFFLGAFIVDESSCRHPHWGQAIAFGLTWPVWIWDVVRTVVTDE